MRRKLRQYGGLYLALTVMGCTGSALATGQTLAIPPRAEGALGGEAFAERLALLTLPERERAIQAQILGGNVPDFLRELSPVCVTNVASSQTNRATFFVTPEYLCVGSNADYFLTPLSPWTAQRIADALNCSLPTRKMVDAIYRAAEVKLVPEPIPPSDAMTTVPVFIEHNHLVRTQRMQQLVAHPLGALTAGHQKDVVISAKLERAPGKVAIYGWHQTNGIPIQPLYLGHTASWVDYSQCIRLVSNEMLVNGEPVKLQAVLSDPALAGLLSDEGVVTNARYSTNEVTLLGNDRRSGSRDDAPAPKITPKFQSSPEFHERIAWLALDHGVRIYINAPGNESPSEGQTVLLVLFALPNGNSIEQTIGKALAPGDDWHFDIQHIGAQIRFLREKMPEKYLVLACLENSLKSWPTWRKKYPADSIPQMVESIKQVLPPGQAEIVLSGHSGGGSLMFGYIDAVKTIPDEFVRISFLDSDYGYDTERHEAKLARWLRAAPEHALTVLAYNDAVALLNGTNFVSAAGGTWGRSHLMIRDLERDFLFTARTNADFEIYSALDGRVRFLLKENPEKKIYHTVQVERNGFIHSLLLGTPKENQGYEYFGPRAYTRWVAGNGSPDAKER